MACAGAGLAVPAGDTAHAVAATATRAGRRFRRRFHDGLGSDRLARVGPRLEGAVLLLEVADGGRGCRCPDFDGREWRCVPGLGTADHDGPERGRVRAGGWGRETSGRRGGGGQRGDRGKDGKRDRSSNGQTVTPATARPSGRDLINVGMPGRLAAAGWQETLYCAESPCGRVSGARRSFLRNAADTRRRADHVRLRSRSRKGSPTVVAATRPRRPSTVHSTSSSVSAASSCGGTEARAIACLRIGLQPWLVALPT